MGGSKGVDATTQPVVENQFGSRYNVWLTTFQQLAGFFTNLAQKVDAIFPRFKSVSLFDVNRLHAG